MQGSITTAAGGKAKWHNHLKDSLVVSYKPKHDLTIQHSKCTPWYLPEGAENISTQKYACGYTQQYYS